MIEIIDSDEGSDKAEPESRVEPAAVPAAPGIGAAVAGRTPLDSTPEPLDDSATTVSSTVSRVSVPKVPKQVAKKSSRGGKPIQVARKHTAPRAPPAALSSSGRVLRFRGLQDDQLPSPFRAVRCCVCGGGLLFMKFVVERFGNVC